MKYRFKFYYILNYYFMYIFILLSLVSMVSPYNICIAGISGRLGRELAYQAITDKNLKVIGLSSSLYPIYKPFRGYGLEETQLTDIFKSDKLSIDLYNNCNKYNYEHLIICTGAPSFMKDYSDILTENIIKNISPDCKSISLVTAKGTNKPTGDFYIELGKIFSLKDTYRAKKKQEHIILNFRKKIHKFIYRPRLLSHGISIFDSTTRYELAEKILNNIENID